jgi:hypothetical protein
MPGLMVGTMTEVGTDAESEHRSRHVCVEDSDEMIEMGSLRM